MMLTTWCLAVIISAFSLFTVSRLAHSLKRARVSFSIDRSWSDVSMEKAVTAVEKGESVRKSAVKYSVPRSTLHDRVSGKVQLGAQPGKKPYLSLAEEVFSFRSVPKLAILELVSKC